MNSYSSNCTLPQDGEKFVSPPNIRGTLNIIWSCLSVLIICTWSVLHPNVPIQSKCERKIHKFHRTVFRTTAKVKWMILNLLAPEWSLAKAWADYRSVSFVEGKFKKVAEVDDVQWERCHCYFANLGGFVINFAAVSTPLLLVSTRASRSSSDSTLASGPSATEALSSESDSVSTGESMLESGTPMREFPADELYLSNQRSDILESAPDLGSEEQYDLTNPTNPQRHERNQDQHNHNLTGQSLSIHSSNSPSLVELNQPTPGVRSNINDLSRPGTHNEQSLPLPLQRKFDRIKRLRPIHGIPQYLQGLSNRIGPVDWTPHDLNTDSVVQCLEEVQLDYFKTSWEQMRFSRIPYYWVRNVHRLQGDRWVVDANQLLLARDLGIIERLPSLSTEEIEDRSTADLVIKSIALIQIAWFLVQVITRLCSHGVTTSPLEIMTLAFAVSTAFTYILLLDKPKDVQTSIIINAVRYATPQEIARLAVAGPSGLHLTNKSPWISNNAIHATDNVANNADLFYGATFSVFILGAIHCIGWNFTYPTDIERLLWRASSIITATAFPALAAIPTIVRKLNGSAVMIFPLSFGIYTVVQNALVYAIFFGARLFVLVEVIRSLAFLPGDAFKTTGPDNFPHIS